MLGDQLGAVTRAYTYNGLGDLTGVQYPATPTLNVSLTPDGEGLLNAWYDGASSGGIDSEDVLGNVLSLHVNYAGLLATLNYAFTYKPDGSPETSSTPVGNFTYGYDGLGRVTSYTTPLGAARWEYEGAPTGRVQRQWLPNGAYTDYTYTAQGQVHTQTNQWDNGTPDDFTDDIVLSAFRIPTQQDTPAEDGYDAAGRITKLYVSLPGSPAWSGTKTFQYYPDGKLQQESFVPDQGTGYTHTFTYDNAGNPTILRGTTTNREYNAANQLTGLFADGQWNRAFVYDDRGNPTTYKGDTLTYDPEGRLTQYGTALTAGYNGDGVRVWKDAGGQRTYFIDGGEMDAAGNVTATDVFGPTGLLARQTVQGQTSTTVFYLFDPLGNVVQRLDANGTVLSVDAYDAWGAQLAGAGDDPYGYKGQVGYYTDGETGLILCTYRYYDPETGRWVNRDPIGYSGGINLYGYCTNEPVNLVDPSGLQWVTFAPNTAGNSHLFGGLLLEFSKDKKGNIVIHILEGFAFAPKEFKGKWLKKTDDGYDMYKWNKKISSLSGNLNDNVDEEFNEFWSGNLRSRDERYRDCTDRSGLDPIISHEVSWQTDIRYGGLAYEDPRSALIEGGVSGCLMNGDGGSFASTNDPQQVAINTFLKAYPQANNPITAQQMSEVLKLQWISRTGSRYGQLNAQGNPRVVPVYSSDDKSRVWYFRARPSK